MEIPIMIFIFLCIVVLMIMLYLMLRSVDELVSTIREERQTMTDQMKTMNRNLERLLMTQIESRDILRAMLGPDHQPGQDAYDDQDKPDPGNAPNITDYILAE